jgi:hypothetical protein
VLVLCVGELESDVTSVLLGAVLKLISWDLMRLFPVVNSWLFDAFFALADRSWNNPFKNFLALSDLFLGLCVLSGGEVGDVGAGPMSDPFELAKFDSLLIESVRFFLDFVENAR